MNAAQKIQHLTGMRPTEVREWRYVYWVQFPGRRPTLYSKKIVDRAAEIETRKLGGDVAARDNRTGKVYILRSNWGMGFDLKEVAKGQVISDYSDFSMVKGKVVAELKYNSRPRKVSEIIGLLACHAS